MGNAWTIMQSCLALGSLSVVEGKYMIRNKRICDQILVTQMMIQC